MPNQVNNSKFDFLILSGDGAGKLAINLYLNLHRRIFSTRGNDLDAVSGDPFRAQLKNSFGNHVVTCWVYSDLDALVTDSTIPVRVKENIESPVLIQLVRDPIKMMVSLYNQRKQRFHLGIGEDPGDPTSYFDQLLPSSYYYKSGSLIAGDAAKWTIFDTTDISGTKAPDTLRTIFELWNINTDESFFQHPGLVTKQNDIIQYVLRNSLWTIDILGIKLQYRLQRDSSLEFMSIFNSQAERGSAPRSISAPDGDLGKLEGWARTVGVVSQVPADIQPFLQDSQLNVVVDERAWVRVDPKVRELIIAENALGSQIQESVLLTLSERIRQVQSVKLLSVGDLDESLINKVKSKLSLDILELFKIDPSLRNKWEVCGDI